MSKRLTPDWKWPKAKKLRTRKVVRSARHKPSAPSGGQIHDKRYTLWATSKVQNARGQSLKFRRVKLFHPPTTKKVDYPKYVNRFGDRLSLVARRRLACSKRARRPDVGSRFKGAKVRSLPDRITRERRDMWLSVKRMLPKGDSRWSSISSLLVGQLWSATYVDASILPYIKVHPNGWIVLVRRPSYRACKKLIDLGLHRSCSFLSRRVTRLLKRLVCFKPP